MIVKRMPAGVYGVNCYIITCDDTKKTAVIDPGGDADKIVSYIEENKYQLTSIILTHGHGDHIGGVVELKNKVNVPIYIHSEDQEMLLDANKNLSKLMAGPNIAVAADKQLEDGEIIELGKLKLNVIHTPGHTRGSICIKVDDLLFTGDTLFANSIGRTDFEGGSFEQIINSIKEKLMIYDDDIKVYPGHGPMSTIGKERTENPFINR